MWLERAVAVASKCTRLGAAEPSTTAYIAAGAPTATTVTAQPLNAEMQAASAMMMAAQHPVPTPLPQPVPVPTDMNIGAPRRQSARTTRSCIGCGSAVAVQWTPLGFGWVCERCIASMPGHAPARQPVLLSLEQV